MGLRLPTQEEFDRLSRLPKRYDDTKKGIVFKEFNEELFLPSTGYYDDYSHDNYLHRNQEEPLSGYYWSSSIKKHTLKYHCLFFNVNSCVMATTSIPLDYKLCIRCIKL